MRSEPDRPAEPGVSRHPALRVPALHRNWFHGVPLLLLAAAVVLGSGGWSLSTVALSLLGWLVLCWAAWMQFGGTVPRWGVLEWSAVTATLLLAAHLVPLPPSFFGYLPGRAAIEADLELAAAAGTWRPLTLDPSGAFRALAAMIPAIAMLVCIRGAAEAAVLKLGRWLVGLACLSVVLGLLQVAGGPESAFRFHDFHNLTGALGFFGYRNHQAGFLLMAVPVAVALLLISTAPSAGHPNLFGRTLLLGAVPLLLLGVALTLSRAGLLLGIVTLGACVFLAWTTGPVSRVRRSLLVAAVVVMAGLVLAAWLAAPGILARFGDNPLEDGRWGLYSSIAETAQPYQPIGAGLGAFEQAFQSAPQNVVLLGAYMNHAHNEWLQLWLELGWPGAVLALIALLASGRVAWRVWRPGSGGSGEGVDTRAGLVLARAATISLMVALVHAYFDYSLRSGATLVVFALLAALLMREGIAHAAKNEVNGHRGEDPRVARAAGSSLPG